MLGLPEMPLPRVTPAVCELGEPRLCHSQAFSLHITVQQSVINIQSATSGLTVVIAFELAAGPVVYDCRMFLAKNADSVLPDTVRLFASSESGVVSDLFADDLKELSNKVGGISDWMAVVP